MPIRKDIRKVLVIGSGPIVIGQACEFDYSGTQACRALREAGLKVVLFNSNPATIMTDADMADRTYIEPMTPQALEAVIIRENVDAILPTMGGQTALNLAIALADRGFFRRRRVEVIGASIQAIRKAEDRDLFKSAMKRIGMEMPRSGMAHTVARAREVARRIGYPVVLRPSFTLAGAGAGIARRPVDLAFLVENALQISPAKEVLIEESVIGWKEYELEVIRDSADNCVVVCSIENVDPMGVHTGDSVTVAPAQTLSDDMFQRLRDAAKKIIREIGVDTGGSNIQFAVHPQTGRFLVIEMNPRVSRSSALASKATGYPIAKVAAKLAMGLTLDEIKNDVTGSTPASFEPSLDYIVTKLPRFAFEKFLRADDTLNTQMKSVGEVMAIGRNFKESLQKAVRGLEIGRAGLGADGRGMEPEVLRAIRRGGRSPEFRQMLGILRYKISTPNCDRLFAVKYALQMGMTVSAIARLSHIDPWFIDQLAQMVRFESRFRLKDLSAAKVWGYSDAQIGFLRGLTAGRVREIRKWQKILPAYSLVDTCAAEFETVTPYYYSTYACAGETPARRRPARKSIVILGGGPNRIGQGIEFDTCCVQAAMTLKRMGRRVVVVNCNPETVSTDPDISDRLYFEPVTTEDVLNVIDRERPAGVIVQLGGQTPLNLCGELWRAGVPILGTPPEQIDRAEDRKKFDAVLTAAGLHRPENGIAASASDVRAVVDRLGFPVMVRPSFVLGGLGMEIIFDREGLESYMAGTFSDQTFPLLIDRYLRDAVEIDVDAVSDGRDTAVVGIMEHVEEAGVHSGDAACFYPPVSLTRRQMEEIRDATCLLAKHLAVSGLINVQFAIQNSRLYVLEVNPRASRTVPFVSKASGVPMVEIAVKAMLGARLRSLIHPGRFYFPKVFCVKESVLPFLKFSDTDVGLGPQMRSTGEVMGICRDPGLAFAKSQSAAGYPLPARGRVMISVQDKDKPAFLPVARDLARLGFSLLATDGTARFLSERGLKATILPKVSGGAKILKWIAAGKINILLNTFQSTAGHSDFRKIRRAALMAGVPIITTAAAARHAVSAVRSLRKKDFDILCLQDVAGTRRGLAF